MNNAKLYATSNGLQQHDATYVIKNHFHRVKWRQEGGDLVLDIGCGSGEFTAYLVRQIIPSSATRLIGVDVSEEMVHYAVKKHKHPKLHFQQLNIVERPNPGFINRFDHIVSFYCMHWIQDQRRAFQNVYDLLRPNGDIFMMFLANNPLFEIYETIAKMDKWTTYMWDVDKYISPYQHSKFPDKEVKCLLQTIGFKDIFCVTESRTYVFEDMIVWRKTLLSVNPFIDRIPGTLKNDYIDEYMNQIKKLNLFEENNNGKKISMDYNLLVVYATKN